jgi:phospho-N-acetylmuramoyl-pentapeptide-transferase
MSVDLVKVLLPAIMAFGAGIALTPLVAHYLYAYKCWKKKGGKVALDGTTATEFNKLHADTDGSHTPRMGGIIIWASVVLALIASTILGSLSADHNLQIGFLSRGQTWIPLFTLLFGAGVGLINDIFDIRGVVEGLPLSRRLMLISCMSLCLGWWFYAKLGITTLNIPFTPFDLYLGIGIVPLFVFTSLTLYASGVIDGIDGLSGGVFASAFTAYTFIAFAQSQYDLAAFSAAVVGGILAFLWFNIPPARFYMTETGTMALTLTLATIAFMTDSLGEGIGLSVLPIIGALLFATVASNVLQILSKKFLGRKLFRIAPLHHHFEAIGWSRAKVTMRYWILSIMCAFIGVLVALVGR